ncbi:MAG: hypothetical protein SF052_11885 [Bacteroidia bacterium]|nr:hypothetical protein [Bacteroidia bacterium]
MKRRLLLLVLILGFSLRSFSQGDEVDVTKLTADTKTFIFSNNKNTVKGYIYEQLEQRTSCCGSDRIYLEVKIDPSGYVLSVKALTGKLECFKESAIDIVKNVKWDASDFKGPKSVYFEIKPSIDCSAERGNSYAKLEIFNNPLLDKQGNPTGSPASVAAVTQPAATQPQTVTPQTPKTEPAVDPNKQIASGTQPLTTPPATTGQARSQETPSVGVPGSPGRPTTTTTTQPQPTEPPTSVGSIPATVESDELREARAREEAERIAQEEEIRRLKERMEKLRAQEEEAKARRLASETQQREKESRDNARQQAAASKTNKPNNAGTTGGEGSGGGLFLDEAEPAVANNKNTGATTPTDPPAGASEEDRIRNEIVSLEQQMRKIEEDKATRDRDLRDKEQQNQRDNQELFKIKEEILRKQELANQVREQKELDRMEIERVRVEDQRRKEEDAYQRMMDEIKRLQDEASRKIADLERQKQDLDNLAAAKQAREQEIMLERVLRQKEQEAQLEGDRLRLMNSGSGIALNTANPATVTVDPTAIPSMTTKEDSAKYLALVQMVNQLQLERARLIEQIRLMEGNPSAVTATSGGDNKKTSGTNTGSSNSATNDNKWKNIDYKKPGESDEIYVASTARPVTPPAATVRGSETNTSPSSEGQTPVTSTPKEEKVPDYTPGKGYSPHPSHKETFANVAGPKFFPRNYVDGRSAMKEKIAEALKNGGVCGLGQAAFSVTLDPKGNVINHKVLATNSAIVELQLHTILPTLKFNEVDVTYDQTIYLEFKADIICNEGADKINLQNVEPIIKD